MAKKKKRETILRSSTHFTIHENKVRDEMEGLGGTDAIKIVEGKWKEVWELKLGLKEYPNLDEVLPVQMGILTEDMNRLWFMKTTGIKVLKPDIISSKEVPFLYASLDGITEDGAIFEAKHVSPFTVKDVTERYYPQIQHYLMVTRFKKAYLSVFIGNSGHKIFEVDRDDEFIFKLLYAESYLWNFVQHQVEPPDFVDFNALPDKMQGNKGEEHEFKLPNPSWISKTIH